MRTPDREHRKLIEDWIEANPYKAETYRADTIEECAQMLEQHIRVGRSANEALAAIRALKDKP